MGVDTHLYIGSRWTIEDIQAAIGNINGGKTELLPSEHSPGVFGDIRLDGKWFCHYHLGVSTPLGRATMLSVSYSEESVAKLRAVAEVIGGALEERDSRGLIRFYPGRLWEEDGLAYFIKYAVLNDGHSGEADMDGVAELRKSINRWLERVDPLRGRV